MNFLDQGLFYLLIASCRAHWRHLIIVLSSSTKICSGFINWLCDQKQRHRTLWSLLSWTQSLKYCLHIADAQPMFVKWKNGTWNTYINEGSRGSPFRNPSTHWNCVFSKGQNCPYHVDALIIMSVISWEAGTKDRSRDGVLKCISSRLCASQDTHW